MPLTALWRCLRMVYTWPSHAALSISVATYVYARRNAGNQRFSFGKGTVNSLAAFASAILLVSFVSPIAIASVERLCDPVQISFDQAILVATLGFLVDGTSAWLLASTPHDHHHQDHNHHNDGSESELQNDHNLRAAYLHVLAAALTSLLAIVALLAGKYAGAIWLAPLMGIRGAILVAHWSWGRLRMSSKVLLDWQADAPVIDILLGHCRSTMMKGWLTCMSGQSAKANMLRKRKS